MTLIVNGERIEDSKIQREVERLRPDYEKTFKDRQVKQREAQLLDWSRENVIETTLLKQEAERRIVDMPEKEVTAFIAQLKKQYDSDGEFYEEFGTDDNEKVKAIIESVLKLNRLFDDIFNDVPEPSREAILQFYQENKEQFKTAEQVRVSHIVKHINWQTDEATAYSVARKIRDELRAGAVFEDLVTKYSDCPENGGDLGYITRGEMVEEFDDIVFNLGIGEISEVFRTRFGFHIAKVYDRKPAGIRKFEEAKGEISEELKRQMRESALDEFIDELRSKARIEQV